MEIPFTQCAGFKARSRRRNKIRDTIAIVQYNTNTIVGLVGKEIKKFKGIPCGTTCFEM